MRISPAKYIAKNKNATGGGAATPASTSGVRPTPNTQKEIVMPDSSPVRSWLDPKTAQHLTPTDFDRLDAQYARWSDRLGIDVVDFIHDCAVDMAQIRRIMGPDEVPLPEFATVHRHSGWSPTVDGTDCVREVDVRYADRGDLTATLEVDQYAVSTRMDVRVRIGDGITEDPAELARWALDLLALVDQWAEIRETHE